MSGRDAFTLRLKPDVLRFVQQAAEEENRSIPNFVETVLIAEKRKPHPRRTPVYRMLNLRPWLPWSAWSVSRRSASVRPPAPRG